MDSSRKNKSVLQPRTFAELLPGLAGILTKDAAQSLTARKKPRHTTAMSRTAEKSSALKPRTMAEMRAEILALKPSSPRRCVEQTSAMKKRWNSSVKVDQKKISCTGGGSNMKHTTVRKVLNFQTKSFVQPVNSTMKSRVTMALSETPRFVKPERKEKKSLHPAQAKPNIRISGIQRIPETPVFNVTKKCTLASATNKENISRAANQCKNKLTVPYKISSVRRSIVPRAIVDTPLSNASDASFLQREQEINETEPKAIETTLQDIEEVSPPVSTPFRKYRSVHEYFNDSSDIENSVVYKDNTIMCFDAPADKREESAIVSLCDLLNKATVRNEEKPNKVVSKLLDLEKATLANINLVDNSIAIMMKLKESQEASLLKIRQSINEFDEESVEQLALSIHTETATINDTITRNFSVIRTCTRSPKSPTYKIPKKNTCLRKKVFYKSMPSVLGSPLPNICTRDQATDMYMKMKEQMNFLNTPVVKRKEVDRPPEANTPAVTSRNLQRQLDRLYNRNS